jgi:glycosyltransferase involved in cell wall biosynthesis
LVKLGEPLPSDPGTPRLLRTGLLAAMLAARGHEVCWWTSSVDHVRRSQRVGSSTTEEAASGERTRILWGPAYRHSVSVRRVIHHRWVAASFRREILLAPRPDIVLCAYPTIELAEAAVEYGRRHGVPVILDLRDMWPDLFLGLLPPWLRPAGRAALAPEFRRARRAIDGAFALTGITDEFIRWGRSLGTRGEGPWDRAFHLSTPERDFGATILAEAERFWDGRGVAAGLPFVASFVGTMSPRMEHGALIDAARLASARIGPGFRLVLCGEGAQRAQLTALARTIPGVIVPGHVDAAHVRVLLQRSTCGLLPYPDADDFRISIPNKVGEYLGAGLPIASSAPGTTARLLAEHGCGFTYPNGDGKALFLGWSSWFQDRDGHMARRRAARQLYEARFDAGVVYGSMCRWLESIAGAPSPARGPDLSSRGSSTTRR